MYRVTGIIIILLTIAIAAVSSAITGVAFGQLLIVAGLGLMVIGALSGSGTGNAISGYIAKPSIMLEETHKTQHQLHQKELQAQIGDGSKVYSAMVNIGAVVLAIGIAIVVLL